MSLPEVTPDMLRMLGPRIILEEVAKMIAADKGYAGVSLECGARGIVSVSYDHRGAGMGQPQEYDRAAWAEICLAMRLAGIKACRHGFENLVRLSEGCGFNTTRWTIYPNAFGEDSFRKLGMLLYRVDEAMKGLYASRLDILE